MAFEVVLPRLGWSMESGRLVEWLKKDGETVQSGDMIFSVEGDKAIQEVEALDSGVLRILPGGPTPEQEVPVGTLLAYICQPGEPPPFESESHPPAASPAVTDTLTAQRSPDDSRLSTLDSRSAGKTISPRARRVARELAVDWVSVKGTGITGRIREQDIRAAALLKPQPAPAGREPQATPVARRAAAELGIDLAALAGAGEGGRITRADVEAAAQKPMAMKPEAGIQAVPMGRLRKLIAGRMAASAQTTAPVTLTTEVDATELAWLRRGWKEDPALAGQVVPTYSDMLIKLVAQALSEFPLMNALLDGEQLIYQPAIHIGMAVDTEAGLVAPVIHDVLVKGLKQIAKEAVALVEKAQAGRLSPDDVSGSTFTVTNLGMYDIDGFTPIINLPECAILGVGRIVPKVVVVDEETEATAVRKMMTLSLTFDHRVVDGAPAARFLKRVRQLIEKPGFWLL